MAKLSIIICTYNPNEWILKKCLESISLACQNITPLEILLIDNNSTKPIASLECVKEFTIYTGNVRIIHEPKQGLTFARLKGIIEAKGDVFLFIDDDNIINMNFLEKGLAVEKNNPHIGAWSGQVSLVFESVPPEWTKRYWGMLVHREFNETRWSNLPLLPETMPCGAGLFVKRKVANFYYQLYKNDKRTIQLDRSADSLLSAGDNDLAACACDIGLGVGLFYELKMEHYIPAKRLTKEYLLKLAEGIAASSIIFNAYRNKFPQNLSFKNKLANLFRLLLKNKTERQFFFAVLKGEKLGKSLLKKHGYEYY